MKEKDACELISYRELSTSTYGLEQWNSLMEQATEIALGYPHHFVEQVAREIIPEDARNHRFYAYLLPKNILTSFCVVIVASLEVEIIWMSTHKKHRRKGYGSELIRYIESDVLDNSCVKMIVIKTAMPTSTLNGTQIGGAEWLETFRFYKSLDYAPRYALEDYWETNDHAALFVKRRDKDRYGYTVNDTVFFSVETPVIEEDIHANENQAIYKDILKYIVAFCQEVSEKKDLVQHTFQSSTLLRGITGIAFVPRGNNIATVFANTTKRSSQKSVRLKFEYNIGGSVLTHMLVKERLPNTGAVFYFPDYDKESEIKVHDAFKAFSSELASAEGYTLFYHRVTNRETEGMSVIYLITPVLQDIVVAKRVWQTYADHSSTLFFGISELIQEYLNTFFKNNSYLEALQRCISFASKPDGERQGSLVNLIRTQNSQRWLKLERERVKAKEIAIVHYGHTLGHRLSPIQAYFDGNEISKIRAKANAVFLRDFSVVLQANNLDSLEALFQHSKKERFLDYKDSNDQFDLVKKIREEWRYLAGSFRLVRVGALNDLQQERVMVNIEFSGDLDSGKLLYMLIDSLEKKACRLKEAFYSQLFSELLFNALQNGRFPRDKYDPDHKEVRVLVGLYAEDMKHGSEVADPDCRVITLVNEVGDKVPPVGLNQTSWTLWPSNRECDGPGMAIAILRRLRLGELWYRYDVANKLFRVAVWLKGLDIDERSETK